MKFERRACVLHPIGEISRIASGRCAEKSMISSSVHGFRVLKRFYAGCFQVAQPLDVVTQRHHRHPKVGTSLPDRANQFATHLRDRCKDMFDSSSHLGDSEITPLLTVGELALGGPFSLNLRAVAIDPQIRLPRLTGVAPVGVNVRIGVGSIEHSFKMLTVVNAGGIGLDFPNQLVAPVRIYRELVAKVTLAMLFRPSGIRILLPAFRGLPVCGRSPLSNEACSSRLTCCLGAGTSVAATRCPPRAKYP